jgi:hypothetical protein
VVPLGTNKIKQTVTNSFMTTQEENWELMTVLGFPWTECEKVGNKDRPFLLQKTVEIKEQVQKQQELEMEMEAQAFSERMSQPQGDGGNPSREDRGLQKPAGLELPGNL